MVTSVTTSAVVVATSSAPATMTHVRSAFSRCSLDRNPRGGPSCPGLSTAGACSSVLDRRPRAATNSRTAVVAPLRSRPPVGVIRWSWSVTGPGSGSDRPSTRSRARRAASAIACKARSPDPPEGDGGARRSPRRPACTFVRLTNPLLGSRGPRPSGASRAWSPPSDDPPGAAGAPLAGGLSPIPHVPSAERPRGAFFWEAGGCRRERRRSHRLGCCPRWRRRPLPVLVATGPPDLLGRPPPGPFGRDEAVRRRRR